MSKKLCVWVILAAAIIFNGCGITGGKNMADCMNINSENLRSVTLSDEPIELENGLSAVRFEGDYGFDSFLEQGGAASDSELIQFLMKELTGKNISADTVSNIFGCSTISVKSPTNEMLFGRNFDWNKCNAMIVMSEPDNGYHSVSTVNIDFIKNGIKGMYDMLPQKMKTIAALYAPLDGMNEKGLCVSVNMIQDSEKINQNTGKPGITTTTAIRLLLDKAANADEAVELLRQYDFHASMGMVIHFAIADASGKSIAVEYIGNEMQVIETPVVTNFYLSPGDKHGIGTEQSHERYDILTDKLAEQPEMTADNVRDALDSVSKDNFNEFESTEWSIVYNQNTMETQYYHRENYKSGYVFYIE